MTGVRQRDYSPLIETMQLAREVRNKSTDKKKSGLGKF